MVYTVLQLCMFYVCVQGPRADELKTLRDRHKYHMKQLELVMRAVDNDAVPLEQVGYQNHY